MNRRHLGMLIVVTTLAAPVLLDAQVARGRGGAGPSDSPVTIASEYVLVFSNADQDARAAMSGPLITGAPYSGRGVTTYTATLSDGTHIKRESSFTIARDTAGRLRREQDDSVWITDPVGQVTYVLKPSDRTARELPLGAAGRFVLFAPINGAGTAGGGARGGRGAGAAPAAPVASRVQRAGDSITYVYAPNAFGGLKASRRPLGPSESLGTKTIEGVSVTGTRMSNTIAANTIGNDRAIVISDERWYSDDLKIVVSSDSKDPRTGDTAFRMLDLKRTEPDHALFVIPPGYKIEKQAEGGRGRGGR